MIDRDKVQAVFLAVLMVGSVVAMSAGAAAAQPSPSEDAATTALDDIDTTQESIDSETTSEDTGPTVSAPTQDVEISDGLREKKGEAVVLLSVERSLDRKALAGADAETLKADSQATLRPVAQQVESLEHAAVRKHFWTGNVLSVTVDLSEHDVEDLAAIKGVSGISPNLDVTLPTPVDPEETEDSASIEATQNYTYGLEQIGVPAFEEKYGDRGGDATVTILDDGVSDPDDIHPDLDFDRNASVSDGNVTEGTLGPAGGHGEHVAGTVSGAADPAGDVPRYGVAPNASVNMVNVFEGGTMEDVLAGIEYSVEKNSDVTTLSLGFGSTTGYSTVSNMVEDTVQDANAAGTLVTVSAGNSGSGDAGGPTTSPGAEFSSMSVGASNAQGNIASFSSGDVINPNRVELLNPNNTYPEHYPREYVNPDVSAPGVEVLSTGPEGTNVAEDPTYSTLSGTSMAAPHVAGAATLLQSVTEEELDPKLIEAALAETAEKPDDAGYPSKFGRDIRYGTGIINVTAAADALMNNNMTVDGTVTDTGGDPIEGASVSADSDALTSTNASGDYTLHTTQNETEVTVDAFGYDASTQTVSSSSADFTLEDAMELELVEGQNGYAEFGGHVNATVDVRNLENLTVSLTEETNVSQDDMTLLVNGNVATFGEAVELDRYNGTAEVRVELAPGGDYSENQVIGLEHTFEGLGDTTNVTTGPTKLTEDLEPAFFELTDIDTVGALMTGEDLPVTVNVTNTGQVTATKDVQMVVEGDAGSGSLPPSSYELEPGETTTVEISAGGVGGLFTPGQEIQVGFRSADSITSFLGAYFVTGLNDEISAPVALQANGTQIEVANLDAPTEVDPGEEVQVDATIQNVGNESGEDTATFSFDGQTLGQQSVSVGPFNASTTDDTSEVSFNVTMPDETGVYTTSVATSNDSASANIGVNVSAPNVTVVSTNSYGPQTVSLLEQGLALNEQTAQVDYASASEVDSEMMANTDVFVFHNLEGVAGDVIPMVEDSPTTTAVYLEQYADANAIAQRSDAIGDPETSIADFAIGGPPVDFTVAQDHPLFDGVAEEGESFEIHDSADSDYVYFTGASGETLAESGLQGSPPAGPTAAVDPGSGSVLLGTIAPNTYEPVDAFTDDAARVLANSVSVAQDGIVSDAVGSTSIDADFVGTVDDAEEVTVTAEGVVSGGELVDGMDITFTVGGEPVKTATVENGSATATFDPATLDASADETLTVSVEEMEVASEDTVETVHETADLEEGYNLLSVPQAAELSADNVSAINTWNTSGTTYESITQSEFDSASDLNQGLYVSAAADDARLGMTFSDDVPVAGTADLAEGWTLTGSNFAIDSDDTRTLDEDLIEVDPSELTVFDSGLGYQYDGNSTIGAYDAYWAYNDEAESHERAIVSPSYETENREDVLGLEDSDFEITDVDATVVPRNEDPAQFSEDDEVLGSDEQTVEVEIEVTNDGGLDTQFVDLQVGDERVARSPGQTLDTDDSTTVTLEYTLSQDDVSGLTVEALTEDDSETRTVEPLGTGGLTVDDQALTLDDEFVVTQVDYNGEATVEVVSNDTVVGSTTVTDGASDLPVDVNASQIEDGSVEVRLLNASGDEQITETATIEDTTIDVTVDDQFAFADADETDVYVHVDNYALIEQTATIDFTADGENSSQSVDVPGDSGTTTSFTVNTSDLSTGDTVNYTATSPDDNASGTLTVAESTLKFDNQSVNADGEVLVENVTASDDQTVVITDTDYNIVGETEVGDINDKNVLVETNEEYSGPGQYIAHIVTDTSDAADGSGLVNDEATIVDADVTVEDESLDVDESQTAEVSEVTVSTADVVDAETDGTNFTVEIRQDGDVLGESDTLNGTNSDETVTLTTPITAEGETEIDAVLVDENGEAFQSSEEIDGNFGTTTVVSDSATVTINVSELSANVALPNQEIGSYNGSDAVLVENVTGQQGQYVVITDSDLNVVGTHAIEGDVAAEDVVVELDDSVEPGEYRAHLTSDVQLEGDDGIVTDTGELYEADLAFDDQEFVGATEEVTVATAELLDGADNTTDFAVAIHETENGSVGDIIGNTTGLNGTESDVLVTLDDGESISENGDYVAMLHFDDSGDLGAPIQAVEDETTVAPVTDSATISSIEGALNFNDQSFNATDGNVVVEDVQANVSSTLVLTYTDADGNLTIAGIGSTTYENATPNDLEVPVDNTSGFPGEHTAHLIPTDEVSDLGSAGDEVSDATAANVTVNKSATVFDTTLTIEDQSVEDSTESVTVTTADLFDDVDNSSNVGDTEFGVAIHENGSASGDIIGFEGGLTANKSDVSVGLDREINSTEDVVAMLHVSNNGQIGAPITEYDGSNLAPVTDGPATVTVQQAEGGNVDLSEQAIGTDGEVVVENVTAVDVETIGGADPATDAFDPADDFLVLTDGDSVADGDAGVIDAVQLSNVSGDIQTGTDVTLNASEATAGEYTVVLHEPTDDGSAPDPAAPRTNASSGEIVNASATVFTGDVAVSDQTLVEDQDALDTITLDTAELDDGSADGATFTVVVENSSNDAELGNETVTGSTTTVQLDDALPRGDTDITVRLEQDGAPVEQAPGFTPITDSATVTTEQSQFDLTLNNVNGNTSGSAEIPEGTANVNVSVDVTNNGDFDDEQNITAEIIDNGTVVASDTFAGFQVFQDETREITLDDLSTGDLAPGTYDVNVSSDDDEVSGELTVLAPNAELEGLSIGGDGSDAELTLDQTTEDIDVTVNNTGDIQYTDNVTLTVSNASGTQISNETSIGSVAAGATQDVTFNDVVVGDLSQGEYDVTVESDDDNTTGTLSVLAVEVTSLDIGGNGTNEVIDEGDGPVDISAQLQNFNDEFENRDVTLTVGDNELTRSFDGFQLSAGETRTLTFDDVAVQDLTAGDYDVSVATPQTNATGTLQVDNLAVGINSADSTLSVIDNETAVVNTTLTNEGDSSVTQTIELNVSGVSGVQDQQQETVGGGNSTTINLSYQTNLSDDGATVTVTSDQDSAQETLSVQSLQDALPADDGSLTLEATTYAENITISANNTTITGAGTDATTIDGNVTIEGDNTTLQDFTVEGNVTSAGDNNDISDITIESNSPGGSAIIEGSGNSLSGVNADDSIVVNGNDTTVSQSSASTVNVGDGVSNANFSQTSASDYNVGAGAEVNAEDVTVSVDAGGDINAAIDDASSIGADTVEVGDGTYDQSVDVDVEGLTLEAAADATPTITQDSGSVVTVNADGVTIDGITVDTDATGVDLDGVSENAKVTLTNNTFELAANSSTGINAGGENLDATIESNTFEAGNNVDGVFVDDASEVLTLTAIEDANTFNPSVVRVGTELLPEVNSDSELQSALDADYEDAGVEPGDSFGENITLDSTYTSGLDGSAVRTQNVVSVSAGNYTQVFLDASQINTSNSYETSDGDEAVSGAYIEDNGQVTYVNVIISDDGNNNVFFFVPERLQGEDITFAVGNIDQSSGGSFDGLSGDNIAIGNITVAS